MLLPVTDCRIHRRSLRCSTLAPPQTRQFLLLYCSSSYYYFLSGGGIDTLPIDFRALALAAASEHARVHQGILQHLAALGLLALILIRFRQYPVDILCVKPRVGGVL